MFYAYLNIVLIPVISLCYLCLRHVTSGTLGNAKRYLIYAFLSHVLKLITINTFLFVMPPLIATHIDKKLDCYIKVAVITSMRKRSFQRIYLELCENYFMFKFINPKPLDPKSMLLTNNWITKKAGSLNTLFSKGTFKSPFPKDTFNTSMS